MIKMGKLKKLARFYLGQNWVADNYKNAGYFKPVYLGKIEPKDNRVKVK